VLIVKNVVASTNNPKNGDYVQFCIIYACMFGFQRVRASGEDESRDTIVWRQTAGRDAKLWRVDRNCASHKSKKTNKSATVRDEQTISIP
jgi:hypothetical protein